MMIYLVNLSTCHNPLQIELKKIQIESGDLSIRQIHYRVDKLLNRLPNLNETESKTLLRYWFGLLLDNVLVEQLLNDFSVVIPQEYIPQSITISMKAASIAREMVTSRGNVSQEIKNIGTMYVVRVAKECGLTTDNHKDIDHLASATSCTWRFARKVLYAIAENDEKSLYQRKMKNNAIKATPWPELISKFVLNESNSRSVPGQEQVSVSYGFRLPKYILLHS